MNDKRLGQAELLGIQECCQRAATRGGALFAVVVHVEHKHGAVERELAARTAVAVSQTIYLKTTSLLRINHCTCYSSDRLHLTRRDRALRCCASAIASSDAVQRLCTLDLCARATLCLDALFNTPLALNTRFEDHAGVVTLHDTGHGVFQLVDQMRRVPSPLFLSFASAFL